MKAISKGSLAGCLVHLNAGSTNNFAQQNLQIPEHANLDVAWKCLMLRKEKEKKSYGGSEALPTFF